ncbi:MAG TPA: hypothetical protein VMU62_08070 [Acidobacteriaceae bacterium]|nr:hypothetical protein [Acidobacteriaceae bacterium]
MQSPARSCGTVILEATLPSATVRLVRESGTPATHVEVTGPGDVWGDEQDRAAIEMARLLLDRGEDEAALAYLGKQGQARLMVWNAPPNAWHVTIKYAPPVAHTTQVRLDAETAATLREMAAIFGQYTSRGTGAGDIGNTAVFLEVLAVCWLRQPDEV